MYLVVMYLVLLNYFFNRLIDIGMRITQYSVILKMCGFHKYSDII
jgi:hypothetical protein